MTGEAVIPLVHGLWREGVCDRAAVIRPLTGADEARLAELGPRATPATRVTALLSSATLRIGDRAPVSTGDVRALTIGDRERLLLSLYHATFGRIEGVARCASPECGAELELDVVAVDLLEPVRGAAGPATHEISVGRPPDELSVCFRLPSGGDQEHVAALAADDPRGAGDAILRRCIISVQRHGGTAESLADVLGPLRQPLAETFARLDPQATTTLQLRCPACDTETCVLLDAGSFLLARLTDGQGIFAEVHRMAQAYHWHEAQILALPVHRRRRYLALIAQGSGRS